MALIMLTLSLALLSFLSSAFVIVRIILPILPPNPLSHKVSPSEFGLPNFRSLSPASKSHLWLASLDILALALFLWQVVDTPLMSSQVIAYDPLSSARLWATLTARQTCLLIITLLTLLYVRLGRPVYFGPFQSLVWAPTLIFVASGTVAAAVFADTGIGSLWAGLAACTTAIGVATSACLGCLIGTLLLIRSNLNAAAQAELEDHDSWPPMKKKIMRRSIATEDLEALKEGSSWITSHRSSSSRQNSISAFSFSTTQHSAHGITNPAIVSAPSILPKSAYWFGAGTGGSTAALNSPEFIPPVPRVPSPYRPRTPSLDDIHDDPFHRSPPREAKSCADSWLTSPSASQATISEWSFSTDRTASFTVNEQKVAARNTSPTVYEHPIDLASTSVHNYKSLSQSQVLGGYAPQRHVAGLSQKASKDMDISILRCVAWAMSIWLPLGISLPYSYLASNSSPFSSSVTSVLLVVSVTISSPLLAFNVLFRLPLPVPAALFSPSYASTTSVEKKTNISEVRIYPEMSQRARSTSMTVVEGRRSGDVWISKRDAIDGRGKAARVLGLLVPSPKLAVLPTRRSRDVDQLLPTPIPDESSTSIIPISAEVGSVEVGMARHRRSESISSSSNYSRNEDSHFSQAQVMVAQRHYSAMVTTVRLASVRNPFDPAAAEPRAVSSAIQKDITRGHMRSQSVASTLQTPRASLHRFPLTPPPSTPLPPTPPNVRVIHSQNHSLSRGSGYSFGPIANSNQIDSLSAGVLPLLVSGLHVGREMIKKDSDHPTKVLILKDPWAGKPKTTTLPRMTTPQKDEFGLTSSFSFHSPELHSTPANLKDKRKRKHSSLPSLGLGKDGVHSLTAWKEDLVQTLSSMEANTPSSRHRRTGHESGHVPPVPLLLKVQEHPKSNVSVDAPIEYEFAVTSEIPKPVPYFNAQLTPPTSASVYSDGFDKNRSSAITPASSATALLTFQEQQEAPRVTYELTTTSKSRRYHLPLQPPIRKSSIRYVKSDENIDPSRQPVQTQSRTPSLRLLGSLNDQIIPKSPVEEGIASTRSPLRKLTLLASRDRNHPLRDNVDSGAGTSPLSISKKAKKEMSGLRPLKLTRSATAKARGLLRQNEVLPEVVVRPPSANEDDVLSYPFQ